ncbi:hypothetical protein UFOVP449_66 [uncultured Caudovirales phage]|uniref:Uncharacterized protein n=1 Tax=uncultured Caudovirales phage TaxID=2100421 RepID=A0A6J5M972_9CAUD|nr:hypothetical protein UFOVP449_66 [uncultured Caudovirales phage]
MKSDILITLIKEVVKTEVKQQVKEELNKLIKSGKVVLNKNNGVQQIKPVSEAYKPQVTKVSQPQFKQSVREITKNPMLNEILNQTQPFTAAHRVEGGPALGATGGSILDAIQPSVSMEGDWETMDYRGTGMPQQPLPMQSVDNEAVDALTKALSRDYRELVKRF